MLLTDMKKTGRDYCISFQLSLRG